MVVLFKPLVLKSILVGIPLSLQGGICDHKYLINGRTQSLLPVPCRFKLCRYFSKFFSCSRSDCSYKILKKVISSYSTYPLFYLKLLGYQFICFIRSRILYKHDRNLDPINNFMLQCTYLGLFAIVLVQPTESHVSCTGLPMASHGWGLSHSLWVLLRLGNHEC